MIKLVGINKIYRTNEIETVALEDVNLTVNKGEFLSIMPPNGESNPGKQEPIRPSIPHNDNPDTRL